MIPGISKTAAPSPAERELVPVIPPIPQSRTDTPSTTATPHKFSVPVISRLEKGKYYLQLGAYHRAELVEPELSRIDSAYPLSVEHTGSPDRPLYRILLGPMNLGESGALLQRFRGIGYHDAFLRVGT